MFSNSERRTAATTPQWLAGTDYLQVRRTAAISAVRRATSLWCRRPPSRIVLVVKRRDPLRGGDVNKTRDYLAAVGCARSRWCPASKGQAGRENHWEKRWSNAESCRTEVTPASIVGGDSLCTTWPARLRLMFAAVHARVAPAEHTHTRTSHARTKRCRSNGALAARTLSSTCRTSMSGRRNGPPTVARCY